MKILFIREHLDYGGASKMIASVAEAMAKRGNECVIYTYAGNICQVPLSDAVTFVKGTPYCRNRFLRHPLKLMDVRKNIKQINPDVIVSFMPYPSITAIIANFRINKKIIISERGDPYVYTGFIKYFGHRIMRFADGAVFQMEGAREFYKGTKLYRISTVIPNAVTINKTERLQLQNRTNDIVYVGRFDIRQKRQDVMIEAFSILAKDFPDVNLIFYGDGPDENTIRELVKNKGLDNRVVFAGSVSPIETYIRDKRMYVLTSDYEGIPNSLIEAMCVGLPCVSTDCSPGGARLLIQNEKNGFIVPKGDSKAVAEACKRILSDPDMGEKMGEEAQQICEKFAPDHIYAMWDQYIKSVVKK